MVTVTVMVIYFFLVFQRIRAALLAISLRLVGDNLAARALPPFSPPSRPILARYCEIAEGTGFLCWLVEFFCRKPNNLSSELIRVLRKLLA